MTDSTSPASFDEDRIVDDIKQLVEEIVTKVTDEDVQMAINQLATDAVGLLEMSLAGADQQLLEDAEQSLNARINSLANLPAMIAVQAQEKTFRVIRSALSFALNLAFDAARVAITKT